MLYTNENKTGVSLINGHNKLHWTSFCHPVLYLIGNYRREIYKVNPE